MKEKDEQFIQPQIDQDQEIVTQGHNQLSPASREEPMVFRGTPGEYFKIWIVNVCLSIVTLGIYSAWAKVRTKRYFYGNTSLGGVSFDYDADPIKILKGRLIIGALFAAVAISQHVSLPVYFSLFVLLFLLLPVFVVKALAFNARYSSYRNVRFSFIGKIGEAYAVFVGLPLLTVFTIGLLYPYVKKRQVEYVMNSHRYGDRSFQFEAGLGKFWAIYGVAFSVMLVMMIASAAAFVTSMSAQDMQNMVSGAAASAPAAASVPEPSLTVLGIVYGCIYFVALFLMAFIQANLTNLTWNNTKFGTHTFRSTQTTWGLFGIYLTNLIAVVVTLGMAIPLALVRLADYRARCLKMELVGDLDVMAAEKQAEVGAAGDAALDLGDFDIDLGI